MIIDNTEVIIDKAIEGYKEDLYKMFGEDLKETEVVYTNFEGKTSEYGYSVSLNVKFRLEGECEGYAVGNIGPLAEKGWYGGGVYASIGKTNDGYVYYGTSTSIAHFN